MQKYLLGLFAVTLAIAAVSFMPKKTVSTKMTNRYWFHCANYAETPSNALLISVLDANFDGIPDEVPFAETDIYGCVVGEDFVCSLGYDDASKIIRLQFGCYFYFLPAIQSSYDAVRYTNY
ncbi:MAG TPA: hypothetical protein VF487_16295 [Chitinophagaceae bacterium]